MTAKSNILTKPAIVAVVIVAATLAVAFLAYQHRSQEAGSFSDPEASGQSQPRLRTLDETGKASFISVFVYDDQGKMASYMVGSGSQEFSSFSDAIAKAAPQEGTADGSFSDLLIVSFAKNETLDLPYSPGKNMIVYNEKLFRPGADLSPMIEQVKQKFNY